MYDSFSRPSRLYAVGGLLYAGFSAWAALAMAHAGPLAGISAVAFLLGATLLGGLNSGLLERRSRKGVLLRALLFQLAVAALVWPRLASEGWARPAVAALMGYSFSLQQVTLATTLLNDLVVSERRTHVDLCYAWVCRAGMAAGVLLAFVCGHFLSPGHAYACAGLPLALSLLTLLPLEVRLKAPVPVRLFSFDRYLRVDRLPLCAVTACAALPLGLLLRLAGEVWVAAAFVPGVALAWLSRRGRGQLQPQVLALAGLAVLVRAAAWQDVPPVRGAAAAVACWGVSLGLSRLLGRFLDETAHCRRGTSQHTHFLGVLAGATLGYVADDGGLTALLAVLVVLAASLLSRRRENKA